MSKRWRYEKTFESVRLENSDEIVAIPYGSQENKHQRGRLIAAALEMYEMITKLVDGITIAELLNGMQVVKVNPVLIESAKRLLAEIDGDVKHE